MDAPYFAGRRYSGAVYNGSTMGVKLKRPLESCFRQIYGDKALHGGNRVARLMCAYAFFGAERMLFESDYTFIPSGVRVGDNIAATRSMPIPQEEKR